MLKTNMMMEVKINQDLSFMIGHKTKMGKVDTILHHGNMLREQRGLRPFADINEIIRKRSFWEFVIAVDTQNFMDGFSDIEEDDGFINFEPIKIRVPIVGNTTTRISDFSVLDKYQGKDGHMKIADLVKLYPHLIQSKRGGSVNSRGHWMNLYLLLKLASMFDPMFEVQIYEALISGEIFESLNGGNTQVEALNIAIDKLPDMVVANDKGRYSDISNEIQKTISIHGAKKQEKKTMIKQLTTLIELKMITSYPQLKEVIQNFTF